jgi:hypothetical protein
MKTILLNTAITLLLLTLSATAQDGPNRFTLNEKYKYLMEGKSDVLVENDGQTQSYSTESMTSMFVSADTIHPDASMHIKLKIEQMLATSDGPQGSKTFGKDVANLELGFTIKSNGEFVHMDSITKELSDDAKAGLSQLQIPLLFKRLKTENMKVGKEWKDESIDTLGDKEDRIIRTTKFVQSVKREETLNGVKCLVIEANGTVETEGTGAMGGKDIAINEKMTIKDVSFYDPAQGVLVQRSRESSSDRELRDPTNASDKATITTTSTLKIELAVK